MHMIYNSAMALARASKGNPVISTATVMLFYVMFNILEAGIEKLIFGERFEHWLDPAFQLAFMAYAAFSVYACAIHNSESA
jgi:hypothetical protein